MGSIASVPGFEEVCSREFYRGSYVCHSGCDFLTPLWTSSMSSWSKKNKRDGAATWSWASEHWRRQWRLRRQLLNRRGVEISSSESPDAILRCILWSLYYNKEKRQGLWLAEQLCRIHPSSVVREDTDRYVVF